MNGNKGRFAHKTRAARWIGVGVVASVVAAAVLFSDLPCFYAGEAGTGEVWALGPPITVRFTGAFYPPEEKEKAKQGARDILKIGIRKEEWIFAVQDVNVISTSITESRLLSAIRAPRTLRLVGPEALLGMVKAPDIVGKRVSMKGYLRPGERILEVSELAPVPEEGR